MPTKKPPTTNPNKVKSITVSEYIIRKDFVFNRLWSLINGELKTFINGQYLTEEQFNERYPMPIVVNFNRAAENPCKTGSYLNG